MFNEINVCSICDEVGQCDFKASEEVGDFICRGCGQDESESDKS